MKLLAFLASEKMEVEPVGFTEVSSFLAAQSGIVDSPGKMLGIAFKESTGFIWVSRWTFSFFYSA